MERNVLSSISSFRPNVILIDILTVDIDLAKNVFAVHGVDEFGKLTLRLLRSFHSANMRFVPIKAIEQQGLPMVHRARPSNVSGRGRARALLAH
jgi:hypothetical protein